MARAGKGKWEGKEVLDESQCKGIEACPGWSHVSVADSIQLFLFFASVHSAHITFYRKVPVYSVLSYSMSSYYRYLEVPSTHYVLHLHKALHLSPSSCHLPHFPQIRHYVDKIGRRDQRS